MAQHFRPSAAARTVSLDQVLRMVDAEAERTFAPAPSRRPFGGGCYISPHLFTTSATPLSDSRSALTWPCRLTERNSGPAWMPAALIHAWTARTGQVAGLAPYGMPIACPWPS